MVVKPKKGESAFTAKAAAFVGIGVVAGVAGVAGVNYVINKSNKPKAPYTLTQWRRVCVNGALSPENLRELLEVAADKGLDVDPKKEIWPYLLGVFEPGTTPETRAQQLQQFQTKYQALLETCKDKEAQIQELVAQQRADALAAQLTDPPSPMSASAASTPTASPGPDLATTSTGSQHQQPYLHGMATSEGVPVELRQFWEAQRIIVMDAIRTDFKKNSLTTVEAITSWFNSALADSTLYQRLSAKDEWWQAGWLSGLARHQLSHASHFSSDQKRQVVRLIGLLSAYAVHDPDTGYCQGMSDLALPFLLVLEDDALAFWCFEALMRKVRRNFAIEDSGIFAQLAALGSLLERVDGTLFYKLRQVRATDCHFAYRMIVVLMRRELPLDQALRLWEMLWADDLQQALGLESDTHTAPAPATAGAAASGMGQDGAGAEVGEGSGQQETVPPALRHASTLQSRASAAALAAQAGAGGPWSGSGSGARIGLASMASAPARVLAALMPRVMSAASTAAASTSAAAAAGSSPHTAADGTLSGTEASGAPGTSLDDATATPVAGPSPAHAGMQDDEGPDERPSPCTPCSSFRTSDTMGLLAAGVLPSPATPAASGATPLDAPQTILQPPHSDPVPACRAPQHTPSSSPTPGALGFQTPGWACSSPTGAAMVDSLQAALPMLPPEQPHHPPGTPCHGHPPGVGPLHGTGVGAGTAGEQSQGVTEESGSHHQGDEATAAAGDDGHTTHAAGEIDVGHGVGSGAVGPAGTAGGDEEGRGSSSQPQGVGARPAGPPLELFLYFVAAVVTAQRRRILDDCTDADDVMRAFQQVPSLRVDVQDCMRRARVYRERDRRQAVTSQQAAAAADAPLAAGASAAPAVTPAPAPRLLQEEQGRDTPVAVEAPATPPQDDPAAGEQEPNA